MGGRAAGDAQSVKNMWDEECGFWIQHTRSEILDPGADRGRGRGPARLPRPYHKQV